MLNQDRNTLSTVTLVFAVQQVEDCEHERRGDRLGGRPRQQAGQFSPDLLQLLR